MLAHGFLSGGSVCRAGRAAHPVAVLIQNNRKGCPERGIPFPVFGASRAAAALRKNACRAQRTEGEAPAAGAETERRPGPSGGRRKRQQSTGSFVRSPGQGACLSRTSSIGFVKTGIFVAAVRIVSGGGEQAAAWSADCGMECRLRQGVQAAAGSRVWRISRSLSRGRAAGGRSESSVAGEFRRMACTPSKGKTAEDRRRGGRRPHGRSGSGRSGGGIRRSVRKTLRAAGEGPFR